MFKQGKSDIAACNANLDNATLMEVAKGCMALKGYVLVQKDQAEEVRSAYSAAAHNERSPHLSSLRRVSRSCVVSSAPQILLQLSNRARNGGRVMALRGLQITSSD